MKHQNRLILALLVVLFSAYTGHAQIFVGPVIGGQAGVITFNDKSNKDLYKTKPYFGYHAGGSVSFLVQKVYFLQASLIYSQRGKTLEGKLDQSFKNKVKYNYIDMPILFTKEFKAKIGKSKVYKWSVGIGPNINYWLGGKGVLNTNDLNENGINPPNYDLPYHVTFGKTPEEVVVGEMNVENPNRIQLGLIFSAGVIFEPAGFNKFMFTARYELGHSFYSPDSDGDFGLDGVLNYTDDLQVRNQGLALSLFYFIDLKTDQKNKGKSTLKLDKVKKGKK